MSKRNKKKRRILVSRLIGIIFILWLVFLFGRGFVQIYFLNQETDKISKEIQAIEMRNEKLREEIDNLQSLEYIEKIAREELGLVKPGETLYILSEEMGEDSGMQVERRESTTRVID